MGVISGNQASHDFWGRQNCSPHPGTDNPRYAADLLKTSNCAHVELNNFATKM